MYIYRSPVGIFTIRPVHGRIGLFIGGECLGLYASAVAAADDVFTHTTGFLAWDMRTDSLSDPTDLSEWQCS